LAANVMVQRKRGQKVTYFPIELGGPAYFCLNRYE